MARETQQVEKYSVVQARGTGDGEERDGGKQEAESQRKDEGKKVEYAEASPDIEQPQESSQNGGSQSAVSRGRTYYFTVPIRPMTGHIPDEALDRLTLYYSLYGFVFAAVGAIAIVLPIVFGVAVETLLAWLLVLGGSITLLMFLLICGAPGTTTFLLLSGLHLAAGIYLLIRPPSSVYHLTLLLAAWFLLHGVLKIFMAIAVRKIVTWPVVLVSGIVSIILAVAVYALTESLGTRLLSISFGADLALTGFALFLIAVMGFLGKTHRSVTDADLINEPLLTGGGHAATSA